jgi:hypothetical protein
MYIGTKFESTISVLVGSLKNVSENLSLLAKSITNETNGLWDAKCHGFRMALRPNFGTANTDTTAQLDSDDGTTGSGFSIGDTGQMLDNQSTPASSNVRAYSLGPGGLGDYMTGSVPGSDGQYPKKSDYEEAFRDIDRQVNLFNLMILPITKAKEDVRSEVWGPASIFCQSRRAFLLIDPPTEWKNVSDVTDEIKDLRIGLVKDHSAIFWPRLKISSNGSLKSVDPAGSISGVMARIDATRGVWKASAGLEADIRGVREAEHGISDDENGVINKQAVNALRVFPDGIICWGSRTMDGYDNSGNTDYKYIPVRRLALFIEESLYRGLKWVVFEPNAEPLWAQIRLNAGAFMHDLFRQGAFEGKTPREAYFVKCDKETTTPTDQNTGIVNIWVGFAPLKPAEFVILYLQQIAKPTEA